MHSDASQHLPSEVIADARNARFLLNGVSHL